MLSPIANFWGEHALPGRSWQRTACRASIFALLCLGCAPNPDVNPAPPNDVETAPLDGGIADTYATAPTPRFSSIDFNKDNRMDIVIAHQGLVRVLLGDGTGRFTPTVNVPFAYAQDLDTADFNADGVPDLAVLQTRNTDNASYAACRPSSIAILVADATAPFPFELLTCLDISGNGEPRAIATSDVDNDNIVDIVVARLSDHGSTLDIYLGRGEGRFADALQAGTTPLTLGDITVTDIDGNGLADIVANSGDIWLGTGEIQFTATPTTTSGIAGDHLAPGDLDADGFVDIVSASVGIFALSLGNGDGTFHPGPSFPGGVDDIMVADVDRDGLPDIVSLAGSNSTITVYRGVVYGNPADPHTMPGNRATAITSRPPTNALPGQLYTYAVTALGTEPLHFAFSDAPDGMSIDPFGVISWTPALAQLGPHRVDIKVTDAVGGLDEQSYLVRVGDPTPTGGVDVLRALAITADTVTLTWDPSGDGRVAAYRLYEYVRLNPLYSEWRQVEDPIVGLSTTVSRLIPGSTHAYAISPLDAAGNELSRSSTLEIKTLLVPHAYHANSASGQTVDAVVGAPFVYDVDALGEPPPTFSLLSGPTGMDVDENSGSVRWHPTNEHQGTVSVVVRAANAIGYHNFSFGVHVWASGTDLIAPGATPDVHCTNITTSGCELHWSDAADNVGIAGYIVKAQRMGHGNSVFTVGQTVGTPTAFTITSLQPDKNYRIWVAAYDAAGNVAHLSGIPPVTIRTLPL